MTSYEIGPIRPPSEAESLLIRVSRNCPWDRCLFCPVYNDEVYEARPVDEVIDYIRNVAPKVQERIGQLFQSAFLQDADPIRLPTGDLVAVLLEVKDVFPQISRITTYGRSDSLSKKPLGELKELRDAGLTRIHRGLETGYNTLLRYMKKGSTPRIQILGGRKVKEAGLELSDYVMPGLGGNLYLEGQPTWKRHAEETARVINEIDPDYVRLRTLTVYPGSRLLQQHGFMRLYDQDIVREIRIFIERLQGISSQIESDHRLNTLMEVRGRLPKDKDKMLKIIDRYLNLSSVEQYAFRIGSLLGGVVTLDRFEAIGAEKLLEQIGNGLGIPLIDISKEDKGEFKLEIIVEEILMLGI